MKAEGKQLRLLAVRLGAERLAPIVGLCQAGTIVTVIDRRSRLGEVPEALRYLGQGHAKGKLVAILE
jgi:NADPH:quinone reductase-like Zn-dependent oxidoreductase